VIAHDDLEEVILIGRGIGFGTKENDILDTERADKVYKLTGKQDSSRYQTLLTMGDEALFKLIFEAIELIDELTANQVNDRIVLSLTDHLLFSIKRQEEGIEITNPYINETRALYQKEYQIDEEVVKMLNEKYHINLPDADS